MTISLVGALTITCVVAALPVGTSMTVETTEIAEITGGIIEARVTIDKTSTIGTGTDGAMEVWVIVITVEVTVT